MSNPLEAYYTATARNLAPFIKEMFLKFSESFNVPFQDVYAVARFLEDNGDFSPDNQVTEIRALKCKEIARMDEFYDHDKGDSEFQLMGQMLPFLASDMQGIAQYCQKPITKVYAVLHFVQSEEEGKGDKIALYMRCSYPDGRPYQQDIFKGDIL